MLQSFSAPLYEEILECLGKKRGKDNRPCLAAFWSSQYTVDQGTSNQDSLLRERHVLPLQAQRLSLPCSRGKQEKE